jgi:DNA-directed RNA polymerase subunit L
MQKVSKINVKVLEQDDELGNSRLEFKLSGPSINYIVANTIRRVTMSNIPIYAFNEFKFDKNSSVFHNNYLKLRLRNMPVWGIENDVDFIENTTTEVKQEEPEEYNYNEEVDDVEIDVEKKLTASTLKLLTMYINAKNKSNEIMTVTTGDAKFYYKEKQIGSPYKTAIPIVKLQPNQEIAFSSITELGTEEKDAMYSAVCISVYKEVKEDEFDFVIESRGQITEKRILEVALINIDRKLKNFSKMLAEENKNIEMNNNEDNKGVIIVNNEDHTLGNLISRGMQVHKSVEFAGYNLPHPLAKKVHLQYKLAKGGKINKVLEDVIEYYVELFDEIKKAINKNIK